MIDVKEAVVSASTYFADLYAGEYRDLALEEVELTSDEKTWLITLGYNVEVKSMFPLGSPEFIRKYKILTVDSETGKVWSMKIRKI